MKRIFVGLEKAETITLGRQGEKNTAAVIWDISQWVNDYGPGNATLLYTLEGAEDAPYPCRVTLDGSRVKWLLTPSELMLGSMGKCQLVYSVGDRIVAKSPVYRTRVQNALGEKSSEPPESFIGWVDDVLEAGAQAKRAAKRAEEAVAHLEDTAQVAQDQIGQASSEAEQMAQDVLSQVTQANSQLEQAVEGTVGQITQASSEAEQTAQDALSAVTQASSEAAQMVEDAAEVKIEQINEITAQIPSVTEVDNGKIMTVVDGKWKAVAPTVSSWEKVQMIVRAGLVSQYFPVGYEFATHDSTNDTDIIWRVVGYDTIQAADESLTHTMILVTKYVYSISAGYGSRRCFDEKEAIYYAEDGLNPGTYYFTIPAGYGGNKEAVETSVSFTLAQSVPAGGVIVYTLPMNKIISNDDKMKTYSSQISTDSIEEVSVSVGANGTNLGIADGNVQNVNYCDRAIGGSNNYAQSAIRQLLNSSADADEFWTPQTRFDMVPSWHNKQPGMMARFPADFLAVVQPAIIKCCTNKVYETNNFGGTTVAKDQAYTLNDRFFLLSGAEIYVTSQGADSRCGEILEFYEGLTNTEKIKYDINGNSFYSWLREASSSSACNVRYISGVYGSLSGSYADFTTPSFTIACIIA